MHNLEDWISFAIDEGDSIPLPEQDDALPSGKWLQRVPRSLHKLVIDRAALEGVSLNSYVSNTLALAVGMAQREEIPSKPTTIDTLQAAAYAQPLFYGIPQVNLNDWTTQLCIGTPQVATFAAKSPKFGVADLGQIDKPYSIFVDSLVGRLPNRTSLVERIPREDEEEYQDQAYAYA
jgi:hypothetical protein